MTERGRPRGFDRAAALRRAMDVFWAKDYDGASLADLTGAMGINPPSLYAAFGSKAELFREAVALYSETEGVEIWNALPDAPTAREAVELFLRRSAHSFTRPGKPRGCLIVLGVLHPNEGNAQLCRELSEHRRANVAALRDRLERGVRERELPKRVDCEAMARFYTTVQQGMSIQARDGAPREALLAVAEAAMSAWDGFTSPGARSVRAPRRTARTQAATRRRRATS
jgi:AcrR family transcriptional regulator